MKNFIKTGKGQLCTFRVSVCHNWHMIRNLNLLSRESALAQLSFKLQKFEIGVDCTNIQGGANQTTT